MVEPAGEASHRFVALDSLRGIAALGVAWHHILATSGPASWPLFRNGGLFIDFFFVLSGFVIASSYGERLGQGFSLTRYAVLRIGRIWPLHAVMVLIGLALELLSLVVGKQGLSAAAPFTGLHDPLHFFTALFLLDGLIPGWNNYYSRASWSISVEVLLYAVSALAFRHGRTGLLPLWGLAASASAALVLQIEAPVATAQVQRGLMGFALGTGCWFIHRRFAGVGLTMGSLCEVLSLAALSLIISWPPGSFSAIAALVPSALVVLVFARENGVISRALNRDPWVWLGAISYSLYMVHAMVKGRVLDVLVLVSRATDLNIAEWTMDGGLPVKRLILPAMPSTLVQIGIVALMLVAAHFAHRWIEEPARHWSRRLAARL